MRKSRASAPVGGALVYMIIIYSRDKKLNRRLVELGLYDVKKLIIRYLCFIPL